MKCDAEDLGGRVGGRSYGVGLSSGEDATAFFYSPAFAENPVGVEFDPEVLLARFRSGEPEADLKRRPSSPKR